MFGPKVKDSYLPSFELNRAKIRQRAVISCSRLSGLYRGSVLGGF